MKWLSRLSAAIALFACSASAHADAPRAVVFAAAANANKADARVVGEVRAAIERLELATLLAEPSLDLDAMQMTIDCVGESADCLGKVAERSNARIVIVPAVVRAKKSATLRILFFDTAAHAEPRTLEHRAHGGALDDAAFAAIPDMLRELFASVAASEPAADAEADTEPAAEEATPAPAATQPAPEDTGPRKPLPLGPILLGAGGVAVLGAGLVVGLMMKDTQDHYAARSVQTPAQAQQADAERKRGKQQALIADVLIGTGAAALLAGGIWFATGLVNKSAERAPSQTALVPVIGSHSAMLALSGVWEDQP